MRMFTVKPDRDAVLCRLCGSLVMRSYDAWGNRDDYCMDGHTMLYVALHLNMLETDRKFILRS
jgi:hypothetical protein